MAISSKKSIEQLESELEQALDTIRALTDQASDRTRGVSIEGVETLALRVDASGQIVYANSALARYLGTKKDDLLGQPSSILKRFLPEEMADALQRPDAGSTATRVVHDGKGKTFELKCTHKHGLLDVVFQDVTNELKYKAFMQRYAVDPDLLSEDDRRTFRFPERRYMTVGFTDMRGFTELSETLSPEEVRGTVNAYLEEVIAAIDDNNATVDKIVGDEVMSLYGAPAYYADHALRAIKTACDQLSRLQKLREDFDRSGRPMPLCGIGINTGDMVLGNLGSSSRQNYTVMGHSVNLASRLCSGAHGGEILTTEATLQAVLENLPEGWESIETTGTALKTETEAASGDSAKVESVLPLPEALAGKVIGVGPDVNKGGAAEFVFSYRYLMKVKGVREPLPVIAVDRPAATQDLDILADTRAVSEADERIFGPYRLLEVVGRGGMGEVWRARDKFGNVVAIKLMQPGMAATASQIRRFRQEAEAMQKLSHRNICRIYEVGEFEGMTYIAMEYIDGVSIGDLISSESSIGAPSSFESRETNIGELIEAVRRERSSSRSPEGSAPAHPGEGMVPIAAMDVDDLQPMGGPREKAGAEGDSPETIPAGGSTLYRVLPMTQSIAIVTKAAEAMQFAHEHGVLHRDLKPGNIMLRNDGEPVIMDFGLAKLEHDETHVSLSVSGQILGTIDYMAPEQAQSSKGVTERADIYSLGAILYQMLTGRRHFEASGNILTDARRLEDFEPISPRKHNRLIEQDLEAVTLKTLRPDPGERYGTMRQLSEDLKAYEAGDPVSAKRPTLFYRGSKFYRKYRALCNMASLLILIVVLFAAVIYYEEQLEWGDWIEVYEEDFTKMPPGTTPPGLVFYGPYLSEKLAQQPTTDGEGLVLPFNTYAWLDQIKLQRDVKVVARVRITGDPPASLRLFLNSKIEPVGIAQAPSGYVAEYASTFGRVDLLSRNETPSAIDASNAHNSNYKSGKITTLTFTREGDNLRFEVDGEMVLSEEDLLPLLADGLERVGLRAYAERGANGIARLLSLSVYRFSLPQKASPVIAGDALVEAGQPEAAFRQYMELAEDYLGTPVGHQALYRASFAASRWFKDDEAKQAKLRELVDRADLPQSIALRLGEQEILQAWSDGQYKEALAGARDVLMADRDTRIAIDMLRERRPELAPELRQQLFELIGRTRRVTSLDLANMGLEGSKALEPIQKLPLVYLDLRDNALESLAPLQGMSLKLLNFERNKIADLDPLKGAPLVILYGNDNQVESLEPLRGMELRHLFLARNNINDIEALRGMPLDNLAINGNPVASIDALSGMKLRTLWADRTQVSDITSLKGMPLRTLGLTDCAVEDLEPLRHAPLVWFYANGNRIKSLEPVKSMQLERLLVSFNQIDSLDPLMARPLEILHAAGNQITSLEPLAGMPLDELDVRDNPITSLGPMVDVPPNQFLFATDTLPEKVLKQAIEDWTTMIEASTERTERRKLERHIHQARVILALRSEDEAKLRELASKYEDNQYLYVPVLATWSQADKLARSVGGHLATITSAAEQRQIQWSIYDGVGHHDQPWIGCYWDKKWRWVSGEDWTYNRLIHPADSMEMVRGMGVAWDSDWTVPGMKQTRGFIIEWSKEGGSTMAATE